MTACNPCGPLQAATAAHRQHRIAQPLRSGTHHSPRASSSSMKASNFFISTLKEAPADAEVKSHQLMMRGGFVKRLGEA